MPVDGMEYRLRELGGQAVSGGTFIGDLLHNLIFYDAPPWAFTLAYVAFALAVALTFYPRPAAAACEEPCAVVLTLAPRRASLSRSSLDLGPPRARTDVCRQGVPPMPTLPHHCSPPVPESGGSPTGPRRLLLDRLQDRAAPDDLIADVRDAFRRASRPPTPTSPTSSNCRRPSSNWPSTPPAS